MSEALSAAMTTTSLVDVAIAFTLLECVALAVYNRRTGRGVAIPEFSATIAAGLCLMLALRCLARGAGPLWVALFLLAAGVAHVADLRVRWRRRAGCPSGVPLASRHS